MRNIEVLIQNSQIREARSLIQSLLRQDRNNFEAIYWRGVCEKMEGNLKEAEKDFRNVTRHNQHHDRAFYGLGLVLESKNNKRGAISAFQKTIAINPSHQQAYNKLLQYGVKPAKSKLPVHPKNNVSESPSTDEVFKGKYRKNYNKLQKYLEQGKWKEADQETEKIINLFIGRKLMKQNDLKKIPCSDLYALDILWQKHSQGRFGFSVQKRIYQGGGGLVSPNGYNTSTFEPFSRRIGWYTFKNFGRKRGAALLGSTELTYNLNAQKGHLPASWILPPQSTGFYSAGLLELLLCIVGIPAGIGIGVATMGEIGILIGIVAPMLLITSLQGHGKVNEAARKANIENIVVGMFSRIQECGG